MEPGLFRTPPKRVVSLIPSITESLFDLGIGDRLVAITDYCIYPQEKVANLPKVGGVINPRVEKIISFHPDLVLANREENKKSTVEALREAGITVWVMFPKTVRESLDDLWNLARIFRSEKAFARLEFLEKSVELSFLSASVLTPKRYFCPIWQDVDEKGQEWWMTFNDDTYAGNLLGCLGGENISGTRFKDVSDQRKMRYPRFTREEVINLNPEIIFLPDESYDFSKTNIGKIREKFCPGLSSNDVQFIRVEGSLIFWQGTRIAKAVTLINKFFL